MKAAALTERRSVMVVGSTPSPDMVANGSQRSLCIPLTQAVIEINLRSPSMLHGKKVFERIRWAFKVLSSAVTWLFYDFEDEDESEKRRLKAPTV